jgi:glucose dehydrogenase
MAAAIAAAVPAAAGGAPQATRVGGDWTRFGYDAARHDVGPASTGITAANVAGLHRQQVGLPGTVDASPIYLRNALVNGARHDTFFMTTTYGITLAVDAASGTVLWRFTPHGYSSWAGSERITNSTPVADPSRRYVYAGAPN